jgi:soluble lytic murein transglycosylase
MSMLLLRRFRILAASAVLATSLPLGGAALASEAASLSAAMDAVRAGDWDRATAAAQGAGPVGRDVVEWHRLRAGRGDFDEAVAFLDRNPDWPGLDLLRRRSEGSVPYGRRAAEVLAFFDGNPPQTGAGSISLASALEASGRHADAEAQIVLAWRTQPMTTGDEASLLQRYGALLRPHHTERLDMLLWQGESEAAERMLPRVSEGWQKLARARMALRAEAPGVDTLIAAVPASLAGNPGLAFERYQWRARKGRNADAIELALSVDTNALGRPSAWADWRGPLSRWAIREGRPRDAYRVAARHGLSEGSDYAELEWLAGYVALTRLDDAETALRHFQRFRVAVSSPISMGRAGYWEGLAEEALGNIEGAAQAYAFGAENQTSFYGLLAAERAGIAMDPALTGTTLYPDWETAAFTSTSVFRAAVLLHDAGEDALAERFLAHLAESQDETGVGQLVDFALSLNEPHIALMIAKRAAEAGIVVPKGYYPLVNLGVTDPRVPLELALSIARRESEFDPGVMSSVGARGLMQVMPGTAQEVASKLAIDFDDGRLLTDPVYNATIGKAYLAQLIETFGHNYVLVSAAYNAGPSRPIRWMSERGDPRSGDIDVVEWIESIPFTETRNYVMRVMESLPVYRARLTGQVQPIRLSEELRQR